MNPAPLPLCGVLLFATRLLTLSAFFAIPQVLLAAQTGPRHISNSELRAEKHGRIVDAYTGAGVPDVKVIANWRTSSTGLSGYYSGGTWCDLQKIATTDADGNYTIPDVSGELDISDRGTHGGLTPSGPLSVKHDADWLLITFKPGYVRVGDREKLSASLVAIDVFAWNRVPDVSIAGGKIEVKPIVMEKVDLSPADAWVYDSKILSAARCHDRTAHEIDAPQFEEMAQQINGIVRPLPCQLPADTPIVPVVRNLFTSIVNDPPFVDRLIAILGNPFVWDDKEIPAGVLCRALTGQGEKE